MRREWKSCDCTAWWTTGSGGSYKIKKMEQMLLSGAQWKHERGNRHKLKYGKFHLKMWKTLFTVKGVKPRTVPPWQIVESPSLELFQEPKWTWLWAACCSWSCFEQGSQRMGSPQVPAGFAPILFQGSDSTSQVHTKHWFTQRKVCHRHLSTRITKPK